MRRIVLALLAALILSPHGAQAEEVALSPRVSAAVVTGNGGIVTYSAALALPEGRHRLDMRLPADADTLEIRLPDGLRALSEARTVRRAGPAERRLTERQQAAREARIAAERALEAHRERIARLEAQRSAALARATLAEATAKSGLGGGDALPDAETLSSLARAIGETVAEARAEAAGLAREIAALGPETDALQRRLREAREREAALIPEALEPSGILSLEVVASGAIDGRLEVDTREAVSWAPRYAFELTQEGAVGHLVIRRRAEVFHNSGAFQPLYPWDSVDLTLSTANLANRMMTPVPTPRILRLVEKGARRSSADYGAALATRKAEAAMDGAMEPMVAPEAPPAPSILQLGQTVLFALGPGQRLDMLADSTVFEIDTVALDVALYAMANAAQDAHAFLYTDLENASTGVLLAGAGPLVRDGTPFGTVHLPTLLPGQVEPLGLGPLHGLRLERTTLSVQEGDSGLITSRSEEEHRFRTVITSALDYPIELRLLDVVPTSESEDLVIEVSASPRPATQARDGARGVLEWRLEMGPGQERRVDFGYRMVWPADKEPVRVR